MALLVKTTLQYEITDGFLTNFKTGTVQDVDNINFQQGIQVSIDLPDQTLLQEISLQSIDVLQQFFILPNQDLRIYLVPQGSVVSDVPYLEFMANKPSLISLKNITQIFVTNVSGQSAHLTLMGVGKDN